MNKPYLNPRLLVASLIFVCFSGNWSLGNERVFSFRGTLPVGSTSHSEVVDGETFTAIFTIDTSIADSVPNTNVGLYSDSVLSGVVIFSGGYGLTINFAGYDVYVLNDFEGVTDGVSVRNASGSGNIIQAITNELGTLVSDSMIPEGFSFAAAPEVTSQVDFQLQLTDPLGTISFTSNVSNNVSFQSEGGFAWKGHNGFFDSSLNWINGLSMGPPSAIDTALFVRDGNYEVWWDNITGSPSSENLIVRNGNVTFENQDAGSYSYVISNSINIEHGAALNLAGISGVNVGLDSTFMAVDGQLNVAGETVVEVTTAVDIGRDNPGVVRLAGVGNEFFVGGNAMYIGTRDIGVLEIRNGANVNDAGSPKIGAMFGGNGHVLVDGFGSKWDLLGDLEVGNNIGTNGTLHVRNSGFVDVGGDMVVAGGVGNSSSNEIELRGGTVSVGNDFEIGGSADGSGRLRIINDGDVFVGNDFVIHENSSVTSLGSGIPDITATTILNYGSMNLGGDIGVDVHGVVNNFGEITTPESAVNYFYQDLRNDGSSFEIANDATVVVNGAYSGASRINGTGQIDFRGAVRPGIATGVAATNVILSEGDVRLGGGSDFTVEVGGTNLNQFDRIWVAGELELSGGQIQTNSIGSFSANVGDEFRVINVGVAATGFFNIPQGGYVGSIGETDVFINYYGGDGNDVFLTTVPDMFLVGDVNFDGNVDLLDVQPFVDLILSGGYVREADIRRDGVIDLLDIEPFVDLLVGS